jgi:hypothetical protein
MAKGVRVVRWTVAVPDRRRRTRPVAPRCRPRSSSPRGHRGERRCPTSWTGSGARPRPVRPSASGARCGVRGSGRREHRGGRPALRVTSCCCARCGRRERHEDPGRSPPPWRGGEPGVPPRLFRPGCPRSSAYLLVIPSAPCRRVRRAGGRTSPWVQRAGRWSSPRRPVAGRFYHPDLFSSPGAVPAPKGGLATPPRGRRSSPRTAPIGRDDSTGRNQRASVECRRASLFISSTVTSFGRAIRPIGSCYRKHCS